MSEVSDVTILRLHFLSDRKVYNLGVVDNKQTGGSVTEPDNDKWQAAKDQWEQILQKIENFFIWLKTNWWVLLVVFGVALLIVFLAVDVLRKGLVIVLKTIVKGTWYIIKYIFIGIGYVVASPVLIIIAIVRAVKKKK